MEISFANTFNSPVIIKGFLPSAANLLHDFLKVFLKVFSPKDPHEDH